MGVAGDEGRGLVQSAFQYGPHLLEEDGHDRVQTRRNAIVRQPLATIAGRGSTHEFAALAEGVELLPVGACTDVVAVGPLDPLRNDRVIGSQHEARSGVAVEVRV